MNRIVLVGRLENRPEIRYTSSGIAVSNFSLSVRRSHPNSEGIWERDVFRIVTWRKLAETCCKYLEKGRMIAVDGKLQNRFLNNQNGERRVMVEIHADDVRFLDFNRQNNRQDDSNRQPQESSTSSTRSADEETVENEESVAVDESEAGIDYEHYLKGEEGTPIDMSEV